MTDKTPEQAAVEALQVYTDKFGHSDNQYAARQTIIKAFQDRAELLASMERILLWDKGEMPSYMRDKALAVITKARSNS